MHIDLPRPCTARGGPGFAPPPLPPQGSGTDGGAAAMSAAAFRVLWSRVSSLPDVCVTCVSTLLRFRRAITYALPWNSPVVPTYSSLMFPFLSPHCNIHLCVLRFLLPFLFLPPLVVGFAGGGGGVFVAGLLSGASGRGFWPGVDVA